jgi:tetratricopeptide (TPR) repeat protein
MPKTHPDEKTLEKFGRGKMARRENLKVVWHLFNCGTCRKELERVAPEGTKLLEKLFTGLEPVDIADSPAYDRAFTFGQSTLEVRGEARDRDRARAPKLFTELMRHPISRQRALIERTWRFKNYVFGEFLLDQSQQQVGDDPSRAEDLAQLALAVAEQLTSSHYGPALVNDLKARAWAYIGNARRVQSDLRSADEAFEQVETFLAQGTDDVLLKARLSAIKGSLRRDQRRFKEAAKLFDSALATYREAGENHWVGRTLLSSATLAQEMGNPQLGIERLKEAAKLIDTERDPRLLHCLKYNLAACLREAGKLDEAKKLLPEVKRLAAEKGSIMDQLRSRWLEGQTLQAAGRLDDAEKVFNQVRDDFIERNIAYDAALASLDLATVYAQQGRTGEMKELAEEMLPIFRSRDVHREATAALLLFQKAAKAESASLKMVREIAKFLREARTNPDLRYQQAS